MGIEPTSRAWEAHVLPLYDTRWNWGIVAEGWVGGNGLPSGEFGELADAAGDFGFGGGGGFLEAEAFAAKAGGGGAVDEGGTEVFFHAAFYAGEVAHEAADEAVAGAGGVDDFF